VLPEGQLVSEQQERILEAHAAVLWFEGMGSPYSSEVLGWKTLHLRANLQTGKASVEKIIFSVSFAVNLWLAVG
jgi:hypothetical protein